MIRGVVSANSFPPSQQSISLNADLPQTVVVERAGCPAMSRDSEELLAGDTPWRVVTRVENEPVEACLHFDSVEEVEYLILSPSLVSRVSDRPLVTFSLFTTDLSSPFFRPVFIFDFYFFLFFLLFDFISVSFLVGRHIPRFLKIAPDCERRGLGSKRRRRAGCKRNCEGG